MAVGINHSALDYYRRLFAARTDVYSSWVDGSPPLGWRPVRQELTTEIIAAALTREGPAVSGYLIAPGNVTHVAAIDFDLEDGMVLARRLAVTMSQLGAPAYVEGSRRGAHVWVALDEVAPAAQVRSALGYWLTMAEMPRDPDKPHRLHPKIELRPATDHIKDDGLGHCLRMPLMPHPKTGVLHRLATADGEMLGPRVSDMLAAIEGVSRSVLAEAAMRYKPVVESIPAAYRPARPAREDDGASASQILRELWGAMKAAPGKAIRCPAHDDEMPSLSILRDDKRAICRSPSCILYNDERGRGTYELRKLAPGALA